MYTKQYPLKYRYISSNFADAVKIPASHTHHQPNAVHR